MSYVIAVPESMAAAAADWETIGSTLNAAHESAAPPTLALAPAAADEISTTIAHLFSRRAEDYQRLAAKAATFHEQLVEHLKESAASYAGAEATNAASLRAASATAGGAVEEFIFNLVLAELNPQLNALAALRQLAETNVFLRPLWSLLFAAFFLEFLATFAVLLPIFAPALFIDFIVGKINDFLVNLPYLLTY